MATPCRFRDASVKPLVFSESFADSLSAATCGPEANFCRQSASEFHVVMTEREREDFINRADELAAGPRDRAQNPGPVLAPLFSAALRRHPDEEGRLLELWDRLTSRPVL